MFKTSFHVVERQDATTEARESPRVGLGSIDTINATVATETIVAVKWPA